MARYIDANLIRYKDLPFSANDKVGIYVGYSSKSEINKIPTADVAEVKHGEWFCIEDCYGDLYRCSLCDMDFVFIEGTPKLNDYNYCPNCGAKMDL